MCDSNEIALLASAKIDGGEHAKVETHLIAPLLPASQQQGHSGIQQPNKNRK
jgi:hypothetical protein